MWMKQDTERGPALKSNDAVHLKVWKQTLDGFGTTHTVKTPQLLQLERGGVDSLSRSQSWSESFYDIMMVSIMINEMMATLHITSNSKLNAWEKEWTNMCIMGNTIHTCYYDKERWKGGTCMIVRDRNYWTYCARKANNNDIQLQNWPWRLAMVHHQIIEPYVKMQDDMCVRRTGVKQHV